MGDPEVWFNDDVATRIGHVIYGPGEIGADNFYNLYLYIHITAILPVVILFYIITMKLMRKVTNI